MIVAVLRRLPLTVRALVLVPLLAVAVDQIRAAVFCAPGASSCLESAGSSWLGAASIVLLVFYAIAMGLWVAREARSASFTRLWLTGTAGVAAVCGGQAAFAAAAGHPAALGGGWPELLALCAGAGALVALALRAAPAAAALVRDLHPAAPRLALALAPAPTFPALPVRPAGSPRSPATAGRAPPSA